jgi:hypothetical protein
MVSLLAQLDGIRFVVLAPHYQAVAGRFPHAVVDAQRHSTRLGDLQRLRAKVYLGLERIPASAVRADSRHICRFDEPCWHVVIQNSGGQTVACVRLMRHPAGYNLARSLSGTFLDRMEPALRRQYTTALGGLIQRMSARGIELADLSAAVADPDYPNKLLGPVLILSACALLATCLDQFLAIAPSHCTVRALYQKLGGELLTHDGRALPPFYDTVYRGNHEMFLVERSEQLRQPPGIVETARELRDRLLQSPVVCREP